MSLGLIQEEFVLSFHVRLPVPTAVTLHSLTRSQYWNGTVSRATHTHHCIIGNHMHETLTSNTATV